MLENNDPSPSQPESSFPDEAAASVRERLQKLREKVSDLSETLDRVEQTAAESGGKLEE